ncbi:hypothetical protein BOH66_06215 [Microbacterium aurum]|uniref:Uncharacterized protein n=1 Tax=Microbacterium aurum TaxID=36805 RepID=A0A1P8U745_9MICO|nr:hypothetical protein [Microbacterium aurum]APZ33893.1 hypothetical protein BOH66_06215 [Microbacterium aurum]MBM7827654.1 hypothetical protein [Microbacterium aurum]
MTSPDAPNELAAFLDAVGQTMYSPEHLTVMALAGPPSESFEEERDGAAWQYQVSERSGVTLQFREQVLVAALIRLVADDEDAAYPALGALVPGLTLPASRADIRAHYGATRHEDPDMDLYLVGDHYLRFDFVDGQSVALTVILLGATA